MGDTLKKVQPGQPLHVPATAYNAFVDAAQDLQDRKLGQQGKGSRGNQFRGGMLLVKNASALDRGRFTIMGIDTMVILPDDNLSEFQNHPILSCVKPTSAHFDRFVILAEPLKIDQVGWAMVEGVTPVKINVTDEDHQYAAVKPNDADKLESVYDGPVRILWKEAGTGNQWGVVSFPSRDALPIRVLNKTENTLREGYMCCPTTSTASPRQLEVHRTTANSMLTALPYSGVDLAADEVGTIRLGHVMRAAVVSYEYVDINIGDFLGTKTTNFYLHPNQFGFVVLAKEQVGSSYYVYVRYSGLPPVVKAVANQSGNTIAVKHCEADGDVVGDTFALPVVPE